MLKKTEEALGVLQEKSQTLFGLNLHVTLSYDLKGIRTIGQCKQLDKKTYIIRLHLPLLQYYKNVYINDVLTHEFAHAIQMHKYKHKVKPHGKEWQEILEILHDKPYEQIAKPKYEELQNLSQNRKYKKYDYTCKCKTTHELTIIRHKRIQSGTQYLCKYCKSLLIPKD